MLIVDDREENRNIASLMLEPLGFKTKEAENGEEALSLYESWQPNVILMDVIMPVMDGLEATQKIKKLKSANKTSILAVSASAMDEERERVLRHGADAFIKKPIRDAELYETIRQYTNIEYEYEELVHIKKTATDHVQTVELINHIPDQLRKKINQAAILGKINLLNEASEEISQVNKTVADYLKELIDNFELETIEKLFK